MMLAAVMTAVTFYVNAVALPAANQPTASSCSRSW